MATSASGQARAGACEDGVQVCVERVHKRTALGKKKRKKEKKEKRKEKEKKEMQTYCKPIYWLHGTGSLMPAVSLWVKGHGRSCADHRPCVEAVGGGHAGDACDVGASSHCRDLALAQKLDLLARQGWGRTRLVFRCMLRGSANAQDWKKKK